jgi:hypothetical protein
MGKKKPPKPKLAIDPDRARGDCFVVAGGGLYWSGTGWVRHWTEALQFTHHYAFDECEALARRLRAAGTPCNPAYIPRS